MEDVKKVVSRIKALYTGNKFGDIVQALPDEELKKYASADLYAYRAMAQLRSGTYEHVQDLAKSSVSLDDSCFLGHLALGIAYYLDHQPDKCIAEMEKAMALNPKDEYPYYYRGLVCYDNRDYAKAIGDTTKAIELNQEFVDAYNLRGLSYYSQKEFDLAIEDYNKAVTINEEYFIAYYNRSLVWYEKTDYDKVIEDATKALGINSSYIDAWTIRGLSHYNKREYDLAIQDYDTAIGLNDSYYIVYYDRALAWYEKNDYEKTIGDSTRAIELNPGMADVYTLRGLARDNRKEYREAIADYDKSLELRSGDPNIYRNRGDAYFDLGEYQKSLDDYSQALAIDEQRFSFLRTRIDLIREKIREQETLQRTDAQDPDKNEKVKLESEIQEIIRFIRQESKSEVKTVVHYTKLFVAEIYLTTDHAKMNYSNAIYMNDPMEGKVFFDFLDDKTIEEAYLHGEKRTETSVYLGSFLPAEENDGAVSHEDELVMWRTYGKDENGKEAAGCNVVISSDFFRLRQPEKEATVASKELMNAVPASTRNSEELLNVIYISRLKNKKSIAHDPEKRIENAISRLKESTRKLIELRDRYKPRDDFYKDIENSIFKYLSGISYLFKSADYSYEHEVRVITYVARDSDSIKNRLNTDANAPRKRFYIESFNDILPYIKKIYLGPKVENYQQWSLYFDYEIRQKAKQLEQMPSASYSIRPSDIEIWKSECRFQ